MCDEPDVDEEILSELFVLLDDGTPDGLIKACDMFLVGVPTALADVRRALSESRVADAGRMAHTLRGTAGAFGATRLGRLAASLEDVCGRTDGAVGGRPGRRDGGRVPGLPHHPDLAPGGANPRLTPVRAGPVRVSEDSRASRARPADGPPSHAIWVSTWTPKAPLASRARAAASAIWWAPSNRIARSAGTVSSAPISPRAQMAWTRMATGPSSRQARRGPTVRGVPMRPRQRAARARTSTDGSSWRRPRMSSAAARAWSRPSTSTVTARVATDRLLKPWRRTATGQVRISKMASATTSTGRGRAPSSDARSGERAAGSPRRPRPRAADHRTWGLWSCRRASRSWMAASEPVSARKPPARRRTEARELRLSRRAVSTAPPAPSSRATSISLSGPRTLGSRSRARASSARRREGVSRSRRRGSMPSPSRPVPSRASKRIGRTSASARARVRARRAFTPVPRPGSAPPAPAREAPSG